MVFRNRGMALRPVHRIKHVVDTQLAFVAGAQQGITIIKAVDAPVLANITEVETGSKVNGIYLKIEAYATSSAALANGYLIVYKNPGANITSPAPNAVGSDDNKRFVIHQSMVMFQKQTDSNPRTMFDGVIVLPRGYRRFGPNDLLIVQMLFPGITADVCLQCHYKEFR